MKLLALIVAAILACATPALADFSTPTLSGSFTTAGAYGQMSLSGQATCGVVITGSATGLSVTPLGTIDNGNTWNPLPSMATMTANGWESGALVPGGMNGFEINVSAIASGTANYTVTCTPVHTQTAAVAQGSNGTTATIACDKTARITGSASAVLIPHTAGKTTYICSYAVALGLVSLATVSLDWGTGTTCLTSTLIASPQVAYGLTVSTSIVPMTLGGGMGTVDNSPVAGTSDYCVLVSGAAAVSGTVRYAQI